MQNNLDALIERVKGGEKPANEQETKQFIIMPILKNLGWDTDGDKRHFNGISCGSRKG